LARATPKKNEQKKKIKVARNFLKGVGES